MATLFATADDADGSNLRCPPIADSIERASLAFEAQAIAIEDAELLIAPSGGQVGLFYVTVNARISRILKATPHLARRFELGTVVTILEIGACVRCDPDRNRESGYMLSPGDISLIIPQTKDEYFERVGDAQSSATSSSAELFDALALHDPQYDVVISSYCNVAPPRYTFQLNEAVLGDNNGF